MKYSTAIIACTAIICSSMTLAAPTVNSESLSQFQRRGGGVSKAVKEFANTEAGRRAAQLAEKIAKEAATQEAQKKMDELKIEQGKNPKPKQTRSIEEVYMDIALREYLERRGGVVSKVADQGTTSTSSDVARKAAEMEKQMAATLEILKQIDAQLKLQMEQKKAKRSIDSSDFGFYSREYNPDLVAIIERELRGSVFNDLD